MHPETVADRLRAFRERHGLSQSEAATMVGVARNSWQRWEGGDMPKGEQLQRLGASGVNLNWLLTGDGPMLTADAATTIGAPPVLGAVDPVLLGRVVDAIKVLYKAEGVRIADIQVGQVAAGWYNQIVAEAPDDPIGQGLALAGRIEEHRAQLRRDAADPAHAKRQA